MIHSLQKDLDSQVKNNDLIHRLRNELDQKSINFDIQNQEMDQELKTLRNQIEQHNTIKQHQIDLNKDINKFKEELK